MPALKDAPTINKIYSEFVEALTPSERLQLAVLILSKIPQQAMVDYSTEWSDEDLHDFSTASINYLDSSTGIENDTAP